MENKFIALQRRTRLVKDLAGLAILGMIFAANVTCAGQVAGGKMRRGGKPALNVISLCDLKKNPAEYNGKQIVLRTFRLVWRHGAVLYDLRCDDHDLATTVVIELDCPNDHECQRLIRALDAKGTTNSNLFYNRVEAIMGGRFTILSVPSTEGYHYRFDMNRVIRAFNIPLDAP
ncbi:MAG: hypothetical protein ABIP75_04185 [Pyrinomonadaceae bacterium]